MRASVTPKSILAVVFAVMVAGSLSAQTVIFSENFEGMSTSSAPTGWLDTGGNASNAEVSTNAHTTGINGSSNVLSFTASGFSSEVATPIIDISSYNPSNYTFTLSFDFLADTSTNSHGGINGVTAFITDGSGNPGVEWVAGSSLETAFPYETDVASLNTWQAFSFDITAQVTDYLNGTGTNITSSQNANQFALAFQQWAEGSGNVQFDNIQLTVTAVPEPAAFAAVLGGLVLAVTTFGRRRRSFPVSG
jgi:hypothetical protein